MELREAAVGDFRLLLWVLSGAVLFVLLITISNVTSLILARATTPIDTLVELARLFVILIPSEEPEESWCQIGHGSGIGLRRAPATRQDRPGQEEHRIEWPAPG